MGPGVITIVVSFLRRIRRVVDLEMFKIKDRQQEVKAVLVASRYIGDYYMPVEVQ